MPYSSSHIPAYRHHKPTGQAVVTIQKKDHYLGKYNSPKSKARYKELIEANFAQLKKITQHYLDHAKVYYQGSTEVKRIYRAFELFHEEVGEVNAKDLSKFHMRKFLQGCVDRGFCRRYSNQLFGCLLRGLKWLSSNDLLEPNKYHDLRLVEPLKRGRSQARDRSPVLPAPVEDILALAKMLHPMQAAMVLVQLYTGMRPGEMLQMRPSSIDTTVQPWVYIPERHKNSYRGQSRKVFLGPQAQAAVAPWIDPSFEYVFSPKKIKVKNGLRVPGNRYLSTSYSRMLLRACIKAKIKPFTPHQLRHTAATRIVASHGWQAARAILGHKSLNTTLIYAETDLSLAMPAIGRLG